MVRARDADVRAAGEHLTERPRHYVIFNPASGRGAGRRRIPIYRSLLENALDHVEFATTTHAGHEHELAARAVERRFDVVVAVGGDGTWSNVADALLASGRQDVALGILPSGTGNDFCRSLAFDPADPREAVRVLAAGHTRSVDVGRIDTPSAPEHAPDRLGPRHFLNLVGFGFDIAVIDAVAHARLLRGALLYKVTALQQLFRFPGIPVRVCGGGVSREGLHLMLTVSNGRYFGGGFPIAPNATIEDGVLHTCSILDAPPFTRLKLFNLAERGRHVTSERVAVMADRSFRLEFEAPPRFEVDGEVRRSSEPALTVRAMPGRLTVVAPRG